MLLSLAIPRINYALRGTDDDAPASGSDEYAYWLDTLNRKKDELYYDVTQLWSTCHEVRALGTVTAGAAISFDFDSDFLAPSDSVYVIDADGHRTDIDLIHPEERDTTKLEVYIAGQNPQTLFFTKEILADNAIVGGTLYVPGYFLPKDVTNPRQHLPFPDANWGIMATASEIAFNDIVYETKAPDLNDKANALYKKMMLRNRRGTYARPRTIPTRVRRIHSPTRMR